VATVTRKDIWVLARELAEALEETPEIQEFRESEDELLNDPEAVALVKEYERRKRFVKFSKDKPQSEQLRLIEEFMAVEERYNNHPVIQRQWAAREAVDRLLERINAVITWPLTGTDAPKSKGGGCGSGGGGCGCG
jgi:cell fate (sporulation/competence/biofilm development) regulator YlbF (YheA/YmcA/DUF963 family)